MKIRSLLLGSVAAAGLATTGFAADLGVVTSLDICDELGLSGLTISSDENCLVISGGVTVEYSIGDTEASVPYQTFFKGGDKTYIEGDGVDLDETVDIDGWLQFVATADSDFGPASATIKILAPDSWTGVGTAAVVVDQAWVSIGDTTMLMAGKKSSIYNDGDDGPLNYLGLFLSDSVDSGVGPDFAVARDGAKLQLVHNLGNGVSIGGGLENLQTSSPAIWTAVGVLAYAGDGISAHVSGAVDQASAWNVHAGFKGTWDPITVVAAVAADDTGYWNALGSASLTFDMFTLAGSVEGTSAGELGAGGSVSAEVSEGVKINLGGKWFQGTADTNWQVEAGISAGVTETITLTAAIGAADSDAAGAAQLVYGKAGLAWAPGGGFTASVNGEANTLGGWKASFKAAKTIK